jgi:hypothetical protein
MSTARFVFMLTIGWALDHPALLWVFGAVAVIVVLALFVRLYFQLTDDPELDARDAETERLFTTMPRSAELHHDRFMPPAPLGAAVYLPEPGERHSHRKPQTPRRASVTTHAGWRRGGAPDASPAVPDEVPGSGPAAGLVTLLPIRGDAQGRDGGCAPTEPRPAARADLTGSLSPRPPGRAAWRQPQDPGAEAHSAPGQTPGPGSEPSGVTGPAPAQAPGAADPPGDQNQGASPAAPGRAALNGHEPVPEPGPALPDTVTDALAGLRAAVEAIQAPTDEERWPHLVAGQYSDDTGTFQRVWGVA